MSLHLKKNSYVCAISDCFLISATKEYPCEVVTRESITQMHQQIIKPKLSMQPNFFIAFGELIFLLDIISKLVSQLVEI